MRRLLVLFCLYTVHCFCTTLVGSLNYPNATGASGYLIMSLSQQAALSSSGGCGGPIEVVPTYQYRITVTAGALIGSPHVYGNDCMLPQGTYYNIQVTDTNANILFTDRWVITGSTIDVGTIVSATITGTTGTLGQAGVVLTQPSSNQTVNQGAGTNLGINLLNVTQILTLPNGGTCDASGCSGIISNAVTTNTVQTISGQKTFSSAILFASTTNLGSTAAPATDGYYSGTVWVGDCLNLFLGPVASYTDTHCWANPSSGNVGLYNAVGSLVANFSDTSGFDSNPLFYVNGGYIQGQAGAIMNTHTGDFACSGVPDGLFTVRTDVSPPELQVCYGGVVYSVVSTAGVISVAGVTNQIVTSPGSPASHNVLVGIGDPLEPPGKVILAAPTTASLRDHRYGSGPGMASITFTNGGAPTSGWVNGDAWNLNGVLQMYDGTTVQSFAYRSTQLGSLSLLPSMGNNTFLGNISGGSAPASALTTTQATAALNQFSSSLKGLVPASGGGTTNYLRADGTWVAPSGGGASAVPQLTDFAGSVASNVFTIGASCSSSLPCRVAVNGIGIFTMTSPQTITINSGSGADTFFIYVDKSLTLQAGYNGSNSYTCSSGINCASGIVAWQQGSKPLLNPTITAGAWNTFTPAMDVRSAFSTVDIEAGNGLNSVIDPTTGDQTLTTDPLQVPRYFADSGAPSSNCTAGRDFYTDTTGLNLYFCDATNAWAQANGSSPAAITVAPEYPFGNILYGSSATTAPASANLVAVWGFKLDWPQTFSTGLGVNFNVNSSHRAFALYNSSGALVANSTTATHASGGGGGGNEAYAWAGSFTLQPGLYYLAFTTDGTSARMYQIDAGPGNVAGTVNNLVTTYATCANPSTGSSTLVFPSSCGALTAYAMDPPFIVIE